MNRPEACAHTSRTGRIWNSSPSLPDMDPEAQTKHRYDKCEEGTVVVDWVIRFVSDTPERNDDENWQDSSSTRCNYAPATPGPVLSTGSLRGQISEDAGREAVVAAADDDDEQHPSGVTGLAGVEVRIWAGPERVRSEHRLGLLWETF
ncbi:hypothetical protein F5X96DRAFT_667648 [Biscogniauxia mediterranea]|nr:hypothetical protein F5X96DRAFT_667648 [Biscogniauxia mediterranea]